MQHYKFNGTIKFSVVMVFTTRSRGLENSVIAPEAAAMSGKQRQKAMKPKAARAFRERRELLVGRKFFAVMTILVEAVMRRLAGARGPQV